MSSVNTQFSVAVHILAGLGSCTGGEMTSGSIAKSVNTSPSFVRRVLAKLSKANIVKTTTGKLGCCVLSRDPKKITLFEVFEAVDAPKPFAIHDYASQKSCSVSCGIKSSMNEVLERTTKAVEKSLKETTLADVIAGIRNTS